MSAEFQILLASSALCGIGVAASLIVRNYRRRWALVSIKGDLTSEHHLPDTIPVPRQHVARVREGDFSFDEAVAWMGRFVRERRWHRSRDDYRRVLRKYELYRQLAEKMGRGLWREVYALGQRLAELDPLDPSASVARGRAMREMGNYPGAIRYFQQALELAPFHSTAFPEMAAACRQIGQPGRFRAALDKARQELGDTHPLTIEGRIQLGELVRVYADPTDPATIAHIPREQYLQNLWSRIEETPLDPTTALNIGRSVLVDDLPELAEAVVERSERDYGESAESQLLQGMVEHYRLNLPRAEQRVQRSLELEDSGAARLEMGRLLSEKAAGTDNPTDRTQLELAAHQQLRLAIDRDPDLVDAIAMLVEPGWSRGLEGVLEAIQPLLKAYPDNWAIWRVMGDAYATENQWPKAIENYQRGLKIKTTDELLLPCLGALEQTNRKKEMLELVRGIKDVNQRDPHLRWKAAQVFCEHQRLKEARKVLQGIVDDEQVPPPLRQRANEVLDQLDDIERQQFRQRRRNKSKPTGQ